MAPGFLLKIPKRRSSTFNAYSSERGYYAEPVDKFSHPRGAPLPTFISTQAQSISHIAWGRPGQSAGSDLRRLNLTGIIELRSPIPYADILNLVPPKIRHYLENALSVGGPIPPESFKGLIKAMHDLDPAVAKMFARFRDDRTEAIGRLSAKERTALAGQKEAIKTALSIAEIEREELLEWSPESGKRSFLDGLPQAYLREDAMIFHDMNVLPGLARIRSSIEGTVTFENERVRLDVLLANRTRLEEQTGTDLIYYNATYKSFVMVQYKAMEPDSSAVSSSFRLPNLQLDEEIRRMDGVLESLAAAGSGSEPEDFRFSLDPFFLKFCPRIILNPDKVDLTPGMYFPLSHWKVLAPNKRLTGPRGGTSLSYENAGRHLNNTDFATLVRGAWVGTNQAQSEMLEPLITDILSRGRAAMIAIKTDKIGNQETEDDF